jgi:hypothetical protein
MYKIVRKLLPLLGVASDISKNRLSDCVVVRERLTTDADPHLKVRLDLIQSSDLVEKTTRRSRVHCDYLISFWLDIRKSIIHVR